MRALAHDEDISLRKAIAEIQYSKGLTKDRVTEYLEIIAATGRFIIDYENDRIKKWTDLPEQKEKE